MNTRAGMLLFLLCGAALLWGGLSGHPAAWSVHGYAYLPRAFTVVPVLLFVGLLFPAVAAALGRALLRVTSAVQRFAAGVLLLAGVAAAVFFFLRLRFQFLGDGQLWVDLIEQGKTVHHFEPLSGELVGWLARTLDAADPASTSGALSIGAGAGFVFLTARLTRTLWTDRSSAALAWFLLLCNPLALLWCGYVESYPLVLLLQSALAWALVRCVRGAFPVWGVMVLMVLVNASHILTVSWWPSLLVLLWWRQRDAKTMPVAPAMLWLRSVLVLVGVTVGVLVLWWALEVSPRGILERLSGQRGIGSLQVGWFFSLRHLLDVSNELVLLLAPALLLGLVSLARGAIPGRFLRTPEGSTLLALLPGPLFLLLVIPPLIGGARDWDLHTALVLPMVLWAADLWDQGREVPRATSRSQKRRPTSAPSGDDVLAGRVAAVALAWTLAWVAIPVDAGRGARHMQALQDPRGTFGAFARAHANEALGIYYRSRDAHQEHAAWLRATEADPLNPRYRINRANAALKLDRIEEAQSQFEVALERGLDEWHVYYNLGVCGLQLKDPARAEMRFTQLIDKYPEEWRGWGGRGEARLALQRPQDALSDLQRAVQMSPQFARGHQLLGVAYHELGQEDAARAAWQRALQLDPSDPVTRRYLSGK